MNTAIIMANPQIAPSRPSAHGARRRSDIPLNSHSAPAEAGSLRISIIANPKWGTPYSAAKMQIIVVLPGRRRQD
ncbi:MULTISPECIES: hypothetical protein [unclassified Xanthomonas]|uniref:hypothetical protein n=1 Tax=unclassified Xanthomonas TaxID=2643310 RepID=UPI001F4581C8|nr:MULTISPECIES: hypothetical protein [unclassified Xanthomonas]